MMKQPVLIRLLLLLLPAGLILGGVVAVWLHARDVKSTRQATAVYQSPVVSQATS